jgi:SP family sugar:H+ symporter-like MFS transporter
VATPARHWPGEIHTHRPRSSPTHAPAPQVIGAGVAQGTHNIPYPSTASWRIPIGLNLLIPLLVFGLVWLIPESPRWLVSKKRSAEAERNLARINRGDPDYDAQRALAAIEEDVRRSEREAAGAGGWSSIFRDPVERRKLISTFGILAGQQIGGVQFIFSYATVIATNLQLAAPFTITIIVRMLPLSASTVLTAG